MKSPPVRARSASTALVAALLLSVPAAAQPPPVPSIAQWEAYLQLVERYHKNGGSDEVTALAELPRSVVESAIDTWQRLVSDTVYRTFRAQRPSLAMAIDLRTIESAAFLHTVAGMLVFDITHRPLN